MALDLIAPFEPHETITLLYAAYFDRAAEPSGLDHWTDAYQQRFADGDAPRAVLDGISSRFAASDEAAKLYPFLADPESGSPETFLHKVYDNLFGRDVDAAGLAYWSDEIARRLDAGQPIGDVITTIAAGAQGDDRAMAENKVRAGASYAEGLANMDGGYDVATARNILDQVRPGMTREEAVEVGRSPFYASPADHGQSGARVANAPVEPTDTLFDGVLSGAHWDLGDSKTITWALADSNSFAFDPAVIESVANWAEANVFAPYADILDLEFDYTGHHEDVTRSDADITIAAATDARFTNALGKQGVLGFAQFPRSDSPSKAAFAELLGADPQDYPNSPGDIAINATIPPHNFTNPGGELIATMVHEVGHALGLKHPFDGTQPGFPSFEDLGVDALNQDTFTAMAYNEFNPSSWAYGNITTPMPVDIGALQYLYGTDGDTNAGDTVHEITNDGRVRTIYDTGGEDTLDASDTGRDVTLDLRPGLASLVSDLTRVGIAPATRIEDATGGRGDNRLIGNGVANTLTGNAGDDTLQGRGGDDVLVGGTGDDMLMGGAGADTAVFKGARNDFRITALEDGYRVSHLAGQEGDNYLSGIETLWFSDGDYSFIA